MSRTRRSIDDSRRIAGAASPVVVFAALVAVVALIAGAAFLLAPDTGTGEPSASSNETASPSPADLSLTDEEAIQRLAELDARRIRALEQRDPSILETVFTPDSPAAKRVRRSIRTLIKDQVRLQQRRYEVQESDVLSNTPSEIRIRQEVLVHVEFVKNGQRVTKGTGKERQVVVRTLKPVGAEWFFYDGRIVSTNRF